MPVEFVLAAATDDGPVSLDLLRSNLTEVGSRLGIQVEQRGSNALHISAKRKADLLGLTGAIAEWRTAVAPQARLTFSGPWMEETINRVVPEYLAQWIRDSIEGVAAEPPKKAARGSRREVSAISRFRKARPKQGVDVQIEVARVRGALADLVLLGRDVTLPYPAAALAGLSGLSVAELPGALFAAQAVDDRHGVTLVGLRLVQPGRQQP